MASSYTGAVIRAQGKKVAGWLKDNASKHEQLEVVLFLDGLEIAKTLAKSRTEASDKLRSAQASRCFFEFLIPDEVLRQADPKALVDVFVITQGALESAPGFPTLLDTRFSRGPWGEVTKIAATVSGWARNGRSPEDSLSVELLINRKLFCTRACQIFNKRLYENAFEHGCYGFEIELPEEAVLCPDTNFEFRIKNGHTLHNGIFSSSAISTTAAASQRTAFSSDSNAFFNEEIVVLYSQAYRS